MTYRSWNILYSTTRHSSLTHGQFTVTSMTTDSVTFVVFYLMISEET